MNEASIREIGRLHPEILQILGASYLALLLVTLLVAHTLWRRRSELHFGQVTALEIPLAVGLAAFLYLLANLLLVRGGFGMILVIVVIGIAFYSLKIPWKKQLGIERLSSLKLLGLIVALGIGILMPIVFFNFISLFLCKLFKIPITVQPGVELFFRASNPRELSQLILLATVAAPLTEELLFRGFLYPLLKRHFSIPVSVIVSAIIFSAVHQHLPTALPLFILGASFALAYEYTGSLPLCMGLHAMFNSSTVATLLILKQFLT